MSDFSDTYEALLAPPVLTNWSRYGGMWDVRISGASTNAATANMVANVATYYPMSLPWAYPVSRVFWWNGSAVASNVDFGIYTRDGTRIYSTGSTAQSGASVPQFVVPTAFILPPGEYYFAHATNGSTNVGWGDAAITALRLRFAGIQQQASAFALPATATFAAATQTGITLCGISSLSASF